MGIFDIFKEKYPIQKIKSELSIESNNRELKVTGVTLINEDAISRQDILRKIKEKSKPFNRNLNIMLKEYDSEGKFAVAVTVNNQKVGDISQKGIVFIKKNRNRMLGIANIHVNENDGVYSANVEIRLKKERKR